ncbi:alanine racemase [Pseudolysinimonas kribbensis]|uniref:alanine racemase n=1 Tax=Pseudolysinimonas kribbensis TaxID=433641 RepID=UPI0031D5AE98
MMREARIDLSAIRDNVAKIRRLVAPARVLAVVKANGYGHGLELAARAALEGGADQLGVADLAEALQLRAAGIDAPVLAWLHAPDADFDAAVDAGIEIGVSSREQLERAVGAVVHLKIDTGLSRNGIPPADWDAAVARAAELERTGVLRVRGVWSHLANAGARETERQRRRFEDAVAAARAAGLDPEVRHLAASEAAIAAPATRYDLVRIGIAMYGLPPAEDVDVAALGLRPAMELAASVAAVRRVPAGEGVSYGFVHRTERETTLALVPLGYADGLPRAATGEAEVAIGGRRHPVVGRIAMDQCVVDVGDAHVAVGDRVVVWGDPATGAPSAEDWAAAAGTIGYEIVTRVGPRVPRVPA